MAYENVRWNSVGVNVCVRGPLSGLVFDAEYLFLKPNRNAQDIAITAPSIFALPVGSVQVRRRTERPA